MGLVPQEVNTHEQIEKATKAQYEEVLSKLDTTNIVGLNANKIPKIQEALKLYTDTINKSVMDLADQNVSNAANACGEENKNVIVNYVNKIIDHIVTYLNSFEPFNDKLSYVKEAYEKARGNSVDANASMNGSGISVDSSGNITDIGNKIDDGMNSYNNNPYIKNVEISEKLAAILPEGVATTEEINKFLAEETLKGNFGNGQERLDKYKELGVNGTEVQNMVNVLKDNSTVNVRDDKIKGYEYGVKSYSITKNEITKKDDNNVTTVNQGNNNQQSVDPNGGNQTTPATVDIKNQGYWGSQSGVGGDGVVAFAQNNTPATVDIKNQGYSGSQSGVGGDGVVTFTQNNTPATVDIKNQGYLGSQSGVGGDGVVDFSHNVTTPNTSVVNNGLPSIQTNNNQPSLPGIGGGITPGTVPINYTNFGIGQINKGSNGPNYWNQFLETVDK